MFMTTNEAQQKMSQDRGLRPLLRHLQTHVNEIIERIDEDYEFEFVGIDAKSEGEAIELRLKELQSYKTLNEVREAEQLPPVPHGDIVPNPSYIGYRNQKELMAQQQQQQGGAMGGQPEGVGFPGGGAKPGPTERAVGDELRRQIGDHTKGKAKKLVDRYRDSDEEESWEETYNASVRRHDLRKATEPLNELLFDD